MPTIQIEAHVSSGDLLQAAAQLPAEELQKFVAEVLVLRAGRQATCLTATETDLLLRINQGLPRHLQERFQELIAQRRQGTLTSAELAELLQLTDQVEELEADRLAALTELAHVRKISLAEVMSALGIRAPGHD